MTYFLTDETIEIGQEYILKGEEAAHILKSRRLKKREFFNIQDKNNNRFKVSPGKLQRHQLTYIPFEQIICPKEPDFKINIFQALVKEKATDFIIQKATELGAAHICFFESQNSQIIKHQKEVDKKLERWNKIALEACKQSDRQIPPKVIFRKTLSSDDLFSDCSTYILNSYSKETLSQKDLFPLNGVNLVIGPEGGFLENEFSSINMKSLYLGPRILRADTAAISSLVLMQYLAGDLSR